VKPHSDPKKLLLTPNSRARSSTMMVSASAYRLVGLLCVLACSLPGAHSAFDITKVRSSWEVVREECKLLGGDLATIKNQAENDQILKLIQDHVGWLEWDLEARPQGPLYLLGLRIPDSEGAMAYDGNFEWADGSPYSNTTYSNWWTERWNWNKRLCPDDPPGYPLSKCFLETRGCWPDCALNDDLIVGIDHGLSWETQGIGSPPGTWSQTSGNGYGVCQLPDDTAVTLELDHPNFLFFMSPNLPTFADIVQWCDDNDGLIASVHNEKENYELGSLLEAFNWTQDPRQGYAAQVFIGLTHDATTTPPSWNWLDGTPFDFENWQDEREPDNLDKGHFWVDVIRRYGTERGYPAWRTTALWRERNDRPMYGVCRLKPADPGFGNGAISLLSAPGGGVSTEIEVTASNFGPSNSEEVEVQVSVGEWGVISGGWVVVGSLQYDILAGQSTAATLSHVFESRAQTSVRAEVTAGGRYGNSDESNDVTLVSNAVLYGDAAFEFWVPFGNAGEEAVLVNGTEVLCLFADGSVGSCCCVGSDAGSQQARRADDAGPNDGNAMLATDVLLVGAPGQDGQQTTLEAKQEVVATVEVPEVPAGGMTLVVRSYVGGQKTDVLVRVEQMSATALLNKPSLCCIRGIEVRVLLESLLLDALLAYEAQDCRRSLKLLRLFAQKAVLVECDLSEDGVRCIEQALQKAVDAGLMIAFETGDAPTEQKRAALQVPTRLPRIMLWVSLS